MMDISDVKVFTNPHASRPLVVVDRLGCNTADDVLIQQCRINNENRALWGCWLRQAPAHKLTAHICGSGPSLADTWEKIPRAGTGRLRSNVFALNNAARFLNERGIVPDYQFICDARQQNVELVGEAGEHFFAAQVHPDVITKAPIAHLVQLQICEDGPDEYERLCVPKDYPDGYSILESTSTVGLQAIYLAYALGYRKMVLHGYDSSNRGTATHASRQFADDPSIVSVTFQGIRYEMSIAMRHQAMRYFHVVKSVPDAEITMLGSGLLPAMVNAKWSEKDKYEVLKQLQGYHAYSPAEHAVRDAERFFVPLAKVVDIGCGPGRATKELARNYLVSQVDFVDSRDDTERISFEECDIAKARPKAVDEADYGFCVDVMEHIAPEDVPATIRNTVAKLGTFYQISTEEELWGDMIGQRLHLTVMPPEEWVNMFESQGYTVLHRKDEEMSTQLFVVP